MKNGAKSKYETEFDYFFYEADKVLRENNFKVSGLSSNTDAPTIYHMEVKDMNSPGEDRLDLFTSIIKRFTNKATGFEWKERDWFYRDPEKYYHTTIEGIED